MVSKCGGSSRSTTSSSTTHSPPPIATERMVNPSVLTSLKLLSKGVTFPAFAKLCPSWEPWLEPHDNSAVFQV